MSEEQQNNDHHTKRDGETLVMLGIFLDALAVPVTIGTFYAVRTPQNWVCLVSGLVLLAIGIGFIVHGRNVLKRVSS